MSIVLFAQNLIEAATLSATPADDAARLARLYDRAQSILWTGGPAWGMAGMFPIALGMQTPTEWIIDIDLGASPSPVTGLGLVNQNITGVTVTLKADATSPPTTTRDSFDPAAATHVLRTIASLTLRYWRLTIPAPAVAPTIGDLMLGVPSVISENPFVESAGRATLGNVRRARSPAGYVRTVKLGDPRVRLAYAWPGLSDANRVLLEAAYSDADEGAKPVLVQDELGVLRWMEIVDVELTPVPVRGAATAADRLYTSRLTLETALL